MPVDLLCIGLYKQVANIVGTPLRPERHIFQYYYDVYMEYIFWFISSADSQVVSGIPWQVKSQQPVRLTMGVLLTRLITMQSYC